MINMRTRLLALAMLALVTAAPLTASAEPPGVGHKRPEHGSLGDVAAKLSNPASDVWALFTQFGMSFSDGDLNTGDAKVSGNMLFEPILPIPIYGEGKDEWRLIVRPTIPLIFGQPIFTGLDTYSRSTGLGDTLLPLPLIAPAGNWILGLGPTFTLPTSTKKNLGRRQWAAGPTGILGYKTKKWIAGVFPQYFFGIGSRGDQGAMPDASYMSLLYFGYHVWIL